MLLLQTTQCKMAYHHIFNIRMKSWNSDSTNIFVHPLRKYQLRVYLTSTDFDYTSPLSAPIHFGPLIKKLPHYFTDETEFNRTCVLCFEDPGFPIQAIEYKINDEENWHCITKFKDDKIDFYAILLNYLNSTISFSWKVVGSFDDESFKTEPFVWNVTMRSFVGMDNFKLKPFVLYKYEENDPYYYEDIPLVITRIDVSFFRNASFLYTSERTVDEREYKAKLEGKFEVERIGASTVYYISPKSLYQLEFQEEEKSQFPLDLLPSIFRYANEWTTLVLVCKKWYNLIKTMDWRIPVQERTEEEEIGLRFPFFKQKFLVLE